MDKCMGNQDTLTKIKSILRNLLTNLGCHEDDNKQIKNNANNEENSEQIITDVNILYFFGMLEKKINEILTTYQYYYEALENCDNSEQQDDSNKSTSSSFRLHQYTRNKSVTNALPPSLDIVLESKLDVIPPKISDYSSSDDDDDDDKNEADDHDNDEAIDDENEHQHHHRQRRPLSSKNEIVKIIPNAENSKNEFHKRVTLLRKQPQQKISSSDSRNDHKSFLVPLV